MGHFAFCPKCGGRLHVRDAGHPPREQPVCRSCGFIFWQNPKPTASVLIRRGGEVLLVRRAIEPGRGMWDIPGGFLNPGEHPEEAAHREVREELGVEIRLDGLVGIFSDTGYGEDDEATINIYYAATMVGGTLVPADDAEEARWFPLDRLPEEIAFQNNRDALNALRRLIREGQL